MTDLPGRQMHAEMTEQPAALGSLADLGHLRAALSGLAPAPGTGIILIARGSSDNAATYGRYLLEWALGRPVVLAAPSLLTRYGRVPEVGRWLIVAISQSGRTPEIIDTLRTLRAAGSRTIGITDEADAPLAEHADFHRGPRGRPGAGGAGDQDRHHIVRRARARGRRFSRRPVVHGAMERPAGGGGSGTRRRPGR